jgi:uncharacterized RDD family membrane protein YckC/Tfp pilus assembly major pilin PilA
VYAPFGRRVLAFLIDFLVLFVFLIISSMVARATWSGGEQAPLFALAPFVCFWLYKALMESSPWQATLGKRALGIKVTTLAGGRIGFGRATGRLFAQPLSYIFFCFGYLMAAFTGRRQALHDYIAGTLVTRQALTPSEIAEAPAITGPIWAGATGATIAVLAVVFVIALIGILAAIAIPAYQNYTIRAQVTDTLMHTDAYKTQVAESLASGVAVALINTTANGVITPRDAGHYATSIEVMNGIILINYGGQANPQLQGQHLAIYPVQNAAGDILWVCGSATPPSFIDPQTVEGQRALTTVGPQFLPTSCHS